MAEDKVFPAAVEECASLFSPSNTSSSKGIFFSSIIGSNMIDRIIMRLVLSKLIKLLHLS